MILEFFYEEDDLRLIHEILILFAEAIRGDVELWYTHLQKFYDLYWHSYFDILQLYFSQNLIKIFSEENVKINPIFFENFENDLLYLLSVKDFIINFCFLQEAQQSNFFFFLINFLIIFVNF